MDTKEFFKNKISEKHLILNYSDYTVITVGQAIELTNEFVSIHQNEIERLQVEVEKFKSSQQDLEKENEKLKESQKYIDKFSLNTKEEKVTLRDQFIMHLAPALLSNMELYKIIDKWANDNKEYFEDVFMDMCNDFAGSFLRKRK